MIFFLTAPIIAVESFDLGMAKVATALNYEKYQGTFAGVVDSVHGLFRDTRGITGIKLEVSFTHASLVETLHNTPMFGAPLAALFRQSLAGQHGDLFDFVITLIGQDQMLAPWPPLVNLLIVMSDCMAQCIDTLGN